MRLGLATCTAYVLLAASPMASYANSGSSTTSDASATSLPFQQGLADRRAWEEWFAGTSGDFRNGAFYWTAQRSLPHPGSCTVLGGNAAAGCLAAQTHLGASDARRTREQDYRLGWNSYQSLSPADASMQPSVSPTATAAQPDARLDTPIGHAAKAAIALTQIPPKLAVASSNVLQAYNSMIWLRTNARNMLGCGTSSDHDCWYNTSAAVMSTNNDTLTTQWNLLWIAETLRETPSMISISLASKKITEASTKVEAFRSELEFAQPPSDFVGVARRAAMSVALLAEVGGRSTRSWATDMADNMGRIQVGYRGAWASVTEPGRRTANVLLEAANLLDEAESELDLATRELPLPNGHTLINTPDTGSVVTSGVRLP
jgi:hypothetical protein